MILIKKDQFYPGVEIDKFIKKNPGSGGISSFVGIARDFMFDNNGKKKSVTSIELEHYAGMAEKQIHKIVSDANSKWIVDDLLVIHRYGIILPEEPIVLICTASVHRKDAIKSCKFIIDFLKVEATFWKKEITNEDNHWVKANVQDEKEKNNWEI